MTSAMDQVAAAIGAGVIQKGTASVMTGTTMVIYMPTDAVPAFKEDSIVPCHYSFDGSYCLLSWSPTAGMALKWFRETFLDKYSFEELSNMAAGMLLCAVFHASRKPMPIPDSVLPLLPANITPYCHRSVVKVGIK